MFVCGNLLICVIFHVCERLCPQAFASKRKEELKKRESKQAATALVKAIDVRGVADRQVHGLREKYSKVMANVEAFHTQLAELKQDTFDFMVADTTKQLQKTKDALETAVDAIGGEKTLLEEDAITLDSVKNAKQKVSTSVQRISTGFHRFPQTCIFVYQNR